MSLRDPVKRIAGCQRGGEDFKRAELYSEKKGQLHVHPDDSAASLPSLLVALFVVVVV